MGLLERVRRENDNPAGYDELPKSIQALYTPKEYLWLSDEAKATLVQTETEPDVTEP